MVRAECRATVGTIGNSDHQNVKIGKAGRKRHMGVRPQTRGTAMNPVDHPHGGGEGSTTPGRHPVTPWGVPTLGYRTRRRARNPTSTSCAAAAEVRVAMSRSSKRARSSQRLIGRIEAMNASGEKRMLRTWSRTSTIFPEMVGTRSPSTTGASTCLFHLGVDGRSQLGEFAPTRMYRGMRDG